MTDPQFPTNTISDKQSGTVEAAQEITGRNSSEEQISRYMAGMKTIRHISTVLRTAQEEDLLSRFLDETLAALDTEAGIIFMYDASRNEICKITARGWFASIADRPIPINETFVAQTLNSGKYYISREFLNDPHLWQELRPHIPPGCGGACLPIHTTDQIAALLFVSVRLPRVLTEEDVHLLSTLTEIAGTAIQHARLNRQTKEQASRLAAIHTIDMSINASMDMRLTLDILLNQLIIQLRVDAADILLLNHHLNILEYAAGLGLQGRGIEQIRVYLGEGLAGRAAMEHQATMVADLGETGNRDLPLALYKEGFVSYYGIPLVAKGQVKGVLEVFHRSPLKTDPEWLDFMNSLAGKAAIAIDNATLFADLQRANLELSLAYDTTLRWWVQALELRDKETEGRTQVVVDGVITLARAMGIAEPELVHLRRGALLHDIGKMGVPDSIILKPGPLTEEEWDIMRQHPAYAYQMLFSTDYLRPALDIPYCHHEYWDGSGYPRGLKGEDIPLAARIFAVVDVYCALTSDRPYRAAWPPEKALAYIQDEAGKIFDPRVVKAFIHHDDLHYF